MFSTKAPTLLLAVMTSVALLAGCGVKAPSAPKTTLPKRAPLQGMQPGYGMAPNGQGMVPGAAGPADPATLQLLAAVRQQQQAQMGFTATVDTWEKGPKDAEAETLKVAYKKPSTLKVHIVKGSGQANDAKVLWDGSENFKIKPSFMPFSVSVAIKDDRVVSKNGWTIKETDVSCILNVLLDPGAQVRPLGDQVVDGKAVTLLDVHSPKSPKGITGEQIGIDRQLGLPGVRLMYKGQTLVYKLIVRQMKLGAPSASDLEI